MVHFGSFFFSVIASYITQGMDFNFKFLHDMAAMITVFGLLSNFITHSNGCYNIG
jgi:hypothetical protein